MRSEGGLIKSPQRDRGRNVDQKPAGAVDWKSAVDELLCKRFSRSFTGAGNTGLWAKSDSDIYFE